MTWVAISASPCRATTTTRLGLSPLLAALLRQNPAQWAAAGEALAATARGATRDAQRHFSLASLRSPSLGGVAGSAHSVQSSAAFSKVGHGTYFPPRHPTYSEPSFL